MRWVIRILVVLVLLVLVGIGGFFLFPTQKIADLASAQMTRATGRAVQFTGGVRPVVFPMPGVRMKGLSIANVSWGQAPAMVTADSVLIGVDLGALLSGQIRLTKLLIKNPTINLERAQDGRANWDFGAADTASEQNSAASVTGSIPAISLKEGRITGARLDYRDASTGRQSRISGIDLVLKAPTPAGKATARGHFRLGRQTLAFDLGLSDMGTALAGALSPVSLTVSGPFGQVSAQGRAGFSPPQAKVALAGDLTDLPALLRLGGGAGAPALALGTRGKLSATVTFANDNTIYLRALDLTLGANHLTGAADIDLAEKPLISANLQAGNLDLSGVFGATAKAPSVPAGSSSGSAWSRAPIDTSALALANGEIAFSAKSIDTGRGKIAGLRLKARLDRSRAVIVIEQLKTYGGTVVGQVVLNGRSGLSAGADLRVQGVSLGPLLKAATGYDRLTAMGSGRIKLLTSGNSMQAMASRLRGEGKVDIGPGEIIGFDLLGMLRTLDPTYRGKHNKTIFSRITGRARIRNGVLQNRDLRFDSALMTAKGAGSINIGQRQIDYRVTPLSYGGVPAGKLSVPVLFSGTWDHVNIHPDLGGALKGDLAKQRAKIEADLQKRAKKAVTDKLQQSLGDALRRLQGGN